MKVSGIKTSLMARESTSIQQVKSTKESLETDCELLIGCS